MPKALSVGNDQVLLRDDILQVVHEKRRHPAQRLELTRLGKLLLHERLRQDTAATWRPIVFRMS